MNELDDKEIEVLVSASDGVLKKLPFDTLLNVPKTYPIDHFREDFFGLIKGFSEKAYQKNTQDFTAYTQYHAASELSVYEGCGRGRGRKMSAPGLMSR